MRMEKIPLLIIAGPTGSGKTALSIELAKQFKGEIISADSMQVYRRMDIATAKPSEEERQGIPHHLMDCLGCGEAFSVADFVTEARKLAAEIRLRGHLPIVVGGTGLYISSLADNISFTDIASDDSLRSHLLNRLREEGGQALLEELRSFDPEMAAVLHPNNGNRIVRAIEVYRLTGITMSEHQRRSRLHPSPYRLCMLGLTCRDRENLYHRINRRVDSMMKQGLLEEAREILALGPLKTSYQAIGYKELVPYFQGACTLEQAVDKIKQESRRYAKRQLTWFRRDSRIHWIEVDESPFQEQLCIAAHWIASELGINVKSKG